MGVLMGEAMIWAATKGFVGGGENIRVGAMGNLRVKYIYICRHKYIIR